MVVIYYYTFIPWLFRRVTQIFWNETKENEKNEEKYNEIIFHIFFSRNNSIMENTTPPVDEKKDTEYLLLPDFKTPDSSWKFFVALLLYTFLLLSYIYTAMYVGSYTPLSANIFESKESSIGRFEKYINDLVVEILNNPNKVVKLNESFTVKDERIAGANSDGDNTYNQGRVKGNTIDNNNTIFDKMRNYINKLITNIFYVKGNTVILST